MAGVLAVAVADTLHLYNNSLLMIHLPSGMAWGNKKELQETIKLLETCEKQLKGVFMSKAKEELTEELLTDLMDAESWLSYEDINKYFNIEIVLLDYCNNKTLLNLSTYNSLKIPTGKLGFLIEEKNKELLENKLKQLQLLVLDNM